MKQVCLIYKWGIKWRHLIDTAFLLIGKSYIHYSKLHETLETVGVKNITIIIRKHCCYSNIHALRLRSIASVNKDYSFLVNLVPRAFFPHSEKSAKIALLSVGQITYFGSGCFNIIFGAAVSLSLSLFTSLKYSTLSWLSRIKHSH